MNQSYKMLYKLAIGFKKWEEQKGSLPEEVHDGLKLMVSECARNQMYPPTDINQLMKILTLPSKEWGISGLESIFPPEASLLNNEFGVTLEAEDFLEEIESPEEYEQSIMKQILLYCRTNNLEDSYRLIRIFLSNKSHSVIPFYKLYDFYGKISNSDLINLVSSCYEEVVNIEHYRKCPNCGWTLEWKKGNWRCNKENTCQALSDFRSIEHYDETDEKLLRMKSGIQKYILLPGMSELRIADKLSKKGYKVTMYPNIDEYDIKVETIDYVAMLDVKDYYNPYQLALYINNKTTTELNDNVWYIIPDYRAKLFPEYQKRVKDYLHDDRKHLVKIFSESEVYKVLGVSL